MEKWENTFEKIERLKKEYEKRHKETEKDFYIEAVMENYIFMVRSAHECTEQIIQNSLDKRTKLKVYKDFPNIVAYYHKKVMDKMEESSKLFKGYNAYEMIPEYDINMFLGILMFPTNEMYLKRYERGELSLQVDGITPSVISAKEKQIRLEKKLFDDSLDYSLLNKNIMEINNTTRYAIDSFTFNLMKLLIFKRLDDQKFCESSFEDIIENYQEYLYGNDRRYFPILLGQYHFYNKIIPYNMYYPNGLNDKYIEPIKDIRNNSKEYILGYGRLF